MMMNIGVYSGISNIGLQLRNKDSGGTTIATNTVDDVFPNGYTFGNQIYSGADSIVAGTYYDSGMLQISYPTNGTPIDLTLRIGNPQIDKGSIWSGTIRQSNGSVSQVVWDASVTSAYLQNGGGPTTYSTAYAWQQDVFGNTLPVTGGSVTLTNIPILLTNTQPSIRLY